MGKPYHGGWGYRNDTVPDCMTGGQHRFGQVHFLPTDKSVMVQACRRCGDRRYTKICSENGQIVEIPVKLSSPSEQRQK